MTNLTSRQNPADTRPDGLVLTEREVSETLEAEIRSEVAHADENGAMYLVVNL